MIKKPVKSGSLCFTLLCTFIFMITLLGIILQNTQLFCFFVNKQVALQKQYYLADALLSYGISYAQQQYAQQQVDTFFSDVESNIILTVNWPPESEFDNEFDVGESKDISEYTGTIEIKIDKKDRHKISVNKKLFVTAALFEKQKLVQKLSCQMRCYKNKEIEKEIKVVNWEK